MSYDLQIWSTDPVRFPDALPNPEKWRQEGGGWICQGGDWQITAGISDKVESEDIPEEIGRLLPGIAYLTELNLSPVTAAGEARRLLNRTAMKMSKTAHGVIFDPQQDAATTARGVVRVAPMGSSQAAALLTLSWWFLSGPIVEGDFAGLVSVMKKFLPEALPRRYGLYEPPQYKFDETGEDHLIRFLKEESRSLGSPVWYAHPPVAGVHLDLPEPDDPFNPEFTCGRLEIEVDSDALSQPGWEVALRRAWKEISIFLRPFFGDVRILGGWIRERGRYWSGGGMPPEFHPVQCLRWRGIPQPPVLAAVLGEPYAALWKRFRQYAEKTGELFLVSSDGWRSGADALATIGPPPNTIAQPPGEPSPYPGMYPPTIITRYPEVFPFPSRK